MIAALLITNGAWLVLVLLLLIAAWLRILRITIARPARPKNTGGTAS